MDTITHGIAGAVIAKAGFSKRLGRIGTITGIVASVLPDTDTLLRFVGEETFIRYHRAIGNSVFFMIPIALIVAFVFNKISKTKALGIFFLLALIEFAAHDFLDLQTSFGTMLLYPFSDRRFSLDLVFIVDFYYTTILLVGIILTYIWKGKGELISRTAIVLIIIYTGFCAYNHSKALNLARNFASNNKIEAINISSLPQPLSPFRWANYIETEKEIYKGFVDLRGRTYENDIGNTYLGRFEAKYNSPKDMQYMVWEKFPDSSLVNKALSLNGLKFFLWFARFPVLLEEKEDGDLHILRFFDLQFGTLEDRYPFLYEVDFNGNGNPVFQGFSEGGMLKLGREK